MNCGEPVSVKTAASLLNAMDQSSDPCDNFFQYACGTWNKLHMIPQDRSSISTFEVMADDLQVILKGKMSSIFISNSCTSFLRVQNHIF
ncbi:neprilysin-1 [Caerostris extrusa]|uniref:Neprilysin-1 n=1 Tax=Caerostris extrusa TaxID=172846 RepID=A0AAV4SGU2_CAEEX|nr:neprilysin-1 [Caerostris extrusa]